MLFSLPPFAFSPADLPLLFLAAENRRHLCSRFHRSRLVPDQARRNLRALSSPFFLSFFTSHLFSLLPSVPSSSLLPSQPSAPGGTSEGILGHVIREMQFEGRGQLTFGASATDEIHPEHNLDGWKIKMLGKAYKKVVSKYGLANRGQFRVRLFSLSFSFLSCFLRCADANPPSLESPSITG
jgi:hypothetical protein